MGWKTNVSRFLNVLTFGHKDELLSARIYENSLTSPGWEVVRITIDTLFFWDNQHCRMNYLWQKRGGLDEDQL